MADITHTGTQATSETPQPAPAYASQARGQPTSVRTIHSSGSRGFRPFAHVALCVTVVALFTVQTGAVVATRAPVFVPNHEFIGYRYFGSLSVLNHEFVGIPLVQGVPMGIFQHVIVWLLSSWLHLPATQISTLETFAYITTSAALLLGASVLLCSWFARRLSLLDKLLLSVVALRFVWPMPTLLQTPDYWTFELPYAIASVLWTLILCRSKRSTEPSMFTIVLLGVWLAIGATLKLTLIALGAFPLILYLTFRMPIVARVRTASGTLLTALTASLLLWFIYFLGDLSFTVYSLGSFAEFLKNPARGATHYADLRDMRVALFENPIHGEDQLVLTLAFVVAIAAVSTVIWRVGIQEKSLLVVPLFVVLGAGGHAYAIWQRPAETTWFDAVLYALFAVPILVSRSNRLGWLTLAATIAVTLHGAWKAQAWDFLNKSPFRPDLQAARQAVADAHAYSSSLRRPVALFLPGNQWGAQSMEQVALYHGGLGLAYLMVHHDPPLMSERILPSTVVLGDSTYELGSLDQRIQAGDAIIWSGSDSLPPEQDVYPSLKPLLDDPRSVVRSWSHRGLGTARTIYVGYIDGFSAQTLAERFSFEMGVRVDPAPTEVNHFLIHASRGEVDLTRVGTVDGEETVTLSDSAVVSFKFDPIGPPAYSSPSYQARWFSSEFGTPVDPVSGETNQFFVRAARSTVDLGRIGATTIDHGASVGVKLRNGTSVGFRFESLGKVPAVSSEPATPSVSSASVPGSETQTSNDTLADLFSSLLEVRVDVAPAENRQFLVRAERGEVDINRLGTIENDLGSNIGMRLPDGTQVGVRFEPLPETLAQRFSSALGVRVDVAPGEKHQFLVRAVRGDVDVTRVGAIILDQGSNVGLSLPGGMQVGMRFDPL